MKILSRLFLLATATTILGGCISNQPDDQYVRRTEGVDPRAGNAVAGNTVLQMVDPWPAGVEDTDIKVPAERSEGEGDDTAAAAPAGGGTTTN